MLPFGHAQFACIVVRGAGARADGVELAAARTAGAEIAERMKSMLREIAVTDVFIETFVIFSKIRQ